MQPSQGHLFPASSLLKPLMFPSSTHFAPLQIPFLSFIFSRVCSITTLLKEMQILLYLSVLLLVFSVHPVATVLSQVYFCAFV